QEVIHSIFRGRLSLKLTSDPSQLALYSSAIFNLSCDGFLRQTQVNDQLYCRRFDRPLIELLTRLFHRIRHLYLCRNYINAESAHNLPQMLKKWTHLRSLCLSGMANRVMRESTAKLQDVFETIDYQNQLRSLRHLYVATSKAEHAIPISV